MSEQFDPYHKWLAIPPRDQPPNHYRLLGLDRFESDPDVIESAADQRMAHVRTFQTGQNSALSQRILNELSAAKLCLLDPKKKAEYDQQLRPQSKGVDRARDSGIDGRGEGATAGGVAGGLRNPAAQPRPMPQAKPMPVVQPLPSSQSRASSPVIIADAGSLPVIHQRRAAKKSSFAPAVLVSVALLALAAGGYWLMTRNKPATEVVTTNNAKPTSEKSLPVQSGQVERVPKTSQSPARTAAPLSPKPNEPPPQAQTEKLVRRGGDIEPAGSSSSTSANTDSQGRDDGHIDLTLAPGVTLRLLRIPASEDGKIKSFYLAQTEVTEAQWCAVMGGKPDNPLFPKAFISFNDCSAFCRELNGQSLSPQVRIRLPSLDEFKLAVGDLSQYTLESAWCDENAAQRIHPVAQLKPNSKGLFDVLGNVWEFAADTKFHGLSVLDSIGNTPIIFESVALPTNYLGSQTDYAGSNVGVRVAADRMEREPEQAKPEVASAMPAKEKNGLLTIFEDEPEFVSALALADNGSQIELDSKEAYSGKASAKVTPSQRFAEMLPGLNVKIRKNPSASDEYRYLRFAWKKRGGGQIWLQLHYPNNWHRYHAGPNYYGAWGGVEVAPDLPTEFLVVTRDLAEDFGEFTFNGLALTPFDGECAWFDHIYLARTLKDFDSIEASPRPRERKFSDLVMGNSSGTESRAPVPNDDEIKKARQEFQKKYSSQIGSARQPEQKRNLALDLIRKAETTGKADVTLYVLLRQASDLAEAAGDLDVAGQAADQLAKSFAVSAVALRQESLTEIAKGNKTPDQCRLLTDAACRLMISALAAGEPAVVKKLASQATSFAKRTKDRAVQKVVTGLTNDAGKLADEFEAVAAARETLKTTPDDPKANQIVGHYELCAAGDWQNALPKLAKSDDASWKQLASDELSLDYKQPLGVRRVRPMQQSTAERQLAVADGWWSKAEDEPWPGHHYLRMRAGVWYSRARSSIAADDRLRADQRLRMLMAMDEGLSNLELLKIPNATEEVGDVVRVQGGWSVETPVDYDGPITVTLVVRTTGDKLHLNSHSHGWPWDFKIEPNRWHVMRYVITAPLRTVFANGMLVFTEKPQTSRTLGTGPVRIHANNNEVLEIKKILVEPLN